LITADRTRRGAGALTLLGAVIALGVAYYAQFGLHMTPCELCLWERWPYWLAGLFGLLTLLVPRAARPFLALAMLSMFADVGIAFLHVGVEFHWWKSPLPECNGYLPPGAPLPATPAAPCDAPAYLFPSVHFSMAAMDFCYALAFAILLAAYVRRQPRRFR
jgi:disulfide bond formation protein DsbB